VEAIDNRVACQGLSLARAERMVNMTLKPKRLGLAMTLGAAALALRQVQQRRHTIRFAGRAVVITGGSRGLGLVLGRHLADEGARLALIARDEAALERARQELEARGADVLVLPCDIRQQDQVTQAIDRAAARFGALDVLINNAGVIQVGPLAHMTVEDFDTAMRTHFWGPLFTILAALPHMRRGARRIVNISSIGGRIAVPHLLPYSVSKFALGGLSEGLQAELARDGFRVTTVYPGLMRTGSTYNASFKGDHAREFGWFHVADSLPGLSIHADRAARQILAACRKGDAELVITLPARLAVLARTAMPETFAAAMSATNRLLPRETGGMGDRARSGWQSLSNAVPSALTRLADRATRENNEVPQVVDPQA
jgi:NAD(P)-dependent dehydrogenase (short-subunit alcohol dehydrogenase family)